jgi:hypothetical protein
VEPVVRLNDSPFDIDGRTLGVSLCFDRNQRRLISEAFDREELRVQESNTNEIRVPGAQLHVVERCERRADVLWNRSLREPRLRYNLCIGHRVGVWFVGVGKQATFGVCEHLWF